MAFFGLKLGLDLETRAAHPHQKFQGVSPPGRSPVTINQRSVQIILLFRPMYNKTIIRLGFCDIQNNKGLGKGQPQPSASADNPYCYCQMFCGFVFPF